MEGTREVGTMELKRIGFLLLISMNANAASVQDITSSLWLRPETVSLERMCQYAERPCEAKHYSIDLKLLEDTPERVFASYLEGSIERTRLIKLKTNEVSLHLLTLLKLAKVKQDPSHRAAFQAFLKQIQSPEPGFKLEAFEGLSINSSSELSNLYIMVKSTRYEYAEILELFVERLEL